jgi:hypothetical protein
LPTFKATSSYKMLLLIICCSLLNCVKFRQVLPDELLPLYGGIDLGDLKHDAEKKLAIIEERSEDGLKGIPKSSDYYLLDIEIDPTLPFHRGGVYRMRSSFTDKYIESGQDTSLSYWINKFTKYYQAEPRHLILPICGVSDEITKWESYVWQLPFYTFKIEVIAFKDTSKNKGIFFSVQSAGDSEISKAIYTDDYEIIKGGDTLKYIWSPKDVITNPEKR